TANDIFTQPLYMDLVYIGANLYQRLNLSGNLLADYYESSPWKDSNGTRTKSLAEFCYNELCMNLNFNYGLKEIHGIEKFTDFDTYFRYTGIRDDLLSTDAKTFATAVKDVCDFYFADIHSQYTLNSPFLGKDITIQGKTSTALKNYNEQKKRYALARNSAIGNNSLNTLDPAPCYTLSANGKTAIVRFDRFTDNLLTAEEIKNLTGFDDIMNEYATKREDEYDTITMIHAVNEKIQADSNIENIVLDLSCNTGGSAFSATFVLSWLLGETTINITNPLSGAKCSATYSADVNLDGEFGGKCDTVQDKNIFCLISPVSFSCGNLVPSVLKASNRATILGVTSGGGAAPVHYTSTADGTIFQISSKYVLSVSKNGSNYDIDQGVEPHYHINRPENFYNTEKIADLVRSINEAKFDIENS
ncbi:MAG: hypothetical protein IJT51_00110, partial [Bacteroidales bacterium]|nr:hypothetical protein [Bacteroidales bacterium]